MSSRGLFALIAAGGGLAYWAHKKEQEEGIQEEEFLDPLQELSRELTRVREAEAKAAEAKAQAEALTQAEAEFDAKLAEMPATAEDLKEHPDKRGNKNVKRKKR